jgi:hypothetical protein
MAESTWQAPGRIGKAQTDRLERSLYNYFNRNTGDIAAAAASQGPRDDYFNTYETVANRLNYQAAKRAAIIPGGLRFAGSALTSPIALTAYGVGGTLGLGSIIEQQAQNRQLAALGLSPEQAELLSNEINMELTRQAQAQAELEAQAVAQSELSEPKKSKTKANASYDM